MQLRPLLLLLAGALLTAPVVADKPSTLNREAGAWYLEDAVKQPVKIKVKTTSTVYSALNGQLPLGNLLEGQLATLVAVSERACRVRGRAVQGDIVGWIATSSLEIKDPSLLEKVRLTVERQKKVQELIDKRQIALGMTLAEVEQSLGKPDGGKSRIDKAGATQTYDYITYDRVPQTVTGRDPFGRIVQSIVYVKVENGRMSVSFEGGAVSAIETTKGPPQNSGVRIAPAPIIIF